MDLYIQREKFREVFAADVAPEVAELMAATQRPIAATALEDTATTAAWKTIPSWTLVATQDLAIPPDSKRFMAARAGSTTVEIDASHAVNVSQPGVVADLIDTAARATAGADLIGAAGQRHRPLRTWPWPPSCTRGAGRPRGHTGGAFVAGRPPVADEQGRGRTANLRVHTELDLIGLFASGSPVR
jgi:hypothetical protein